MDENTEKAKKLMTFWPIAVAIVAGIYSAGVYAHATTSNTSRIEKLEKSDADKAQALSDLQSDVRVIKLILSRAYPGLVPSE